MINNSFQTQFGIQQVDFGDLTGTAVASQLGSTLALSAASLTLTGFLAFSNANGISAAGTTQGTATVLTADTSTVTTVGGGQGVVLPSGVGREITVINRGANALLVYPASGSSIDGAAANAPVSIPVNGWITLNCISATQYFTIDPVTVGGTGISITQSNNGTLTITNSGVTSLVAGTDISVSGATGAVTVNGTSTLSTVTGRGASTATALTLSNTTTTSSAATGALIVSGGIGVGGNVYSNSNIRGGSITTPGAITGGGLLSMGAVGGVSAGGTTQGTATVLSNYSIQHITTAAAGTGVMLPTSNGGTICTIINSGANAVLVYPGTGGAIDTGSVNAAFSIPVNGVWTGETISSGASATWWTATPLLIPGTNISVTYGVGGATLAVTGTVASATTATSATSATTSTNLSGGAAQSIPYQTATGATSMLAVGGNGTTLQVVGGVLTWATASATNATNVSGGATNSIPYQTAASTTGFIAAGTNGYILSSVSGVPTWTAPVAGTSITGTANQVIASASTGAVTLSLPQSIATTSTPTFSTVTHGASGCTIGAAPSLYGSTTITGSTSQWAGLQFGSSYQLQTLMISDSTQSSRISGIYSVTNGGWDWYWTNGTLTAGTVPGSLVSGTVPNASTAGGFTPSATAGTASRIVVADSSGYITNTYINCSDGGTSGTAGTVSAIVCKQGDNYYRSTSAASVCNYIAGSFGAITSSGVVTATGFTVSSDRNLKTNIQPIVNSEDIVASLNGVRFNWKDSGKASVGLIAQDVEVLLPELVEVNEVTGFKGVNYDAIIGVLIEEVKALRKEVTQLKAR